MTDTTTRDPFAFAREDDDRPLTPAELRLMHGLADNIPRYAYLKPHLPPAPPLTPDEERERATLRAAFMMMMAEGPA